MYDWLSLRSFLMPDEKRFSCLLHEHPQSITNLFGSALLRNLLKLRRCTTVHQVVRQTRLREDICRYGWHVVSQTA